MQNRNRVILKSEREIGIMRDASCYVAEILEILCARVEPGMSTWDIDVISRQEIAKRPVSSAFLGYRGYPATVCTSVNEEIVHGIPLKKKVLQEGDIIGIDYGLVYKGYVGDSARTIAIGTVSDRASRLIEVTRRCLELAIEVCTPEHRLSDIGMVVQKHAEKHGYGVVRDFVGHGIGTAMHEEPQVLNYYDGPKPRLKEGLVIAIEPMINEGSYGVEVLEDGWTAVTDDGRLSAHFEHTIAITRNGPMVLSVS